MTANFVWLHRLAKLLHCVTSTRVSAKLEQQPTPASSSSIEDYYDAKQFMTKTEILLKEEKYCIVSSRVEDGDVDTPSNYGKPSLDTAV